MARKIVVQEFITLDGVMQAPGGSKEDEAEGFKYGGWTAPFFKVADKEGGDFMKRWMESTEILLGKKHSRFLQDTGPNMQTCGEA